MEKKSSTLAEVCAGTEVRDNRTYILSLLRYLFPFIWAVTLGVLGSFYNIRAGSLRISLWQLLFNSIKQGRATLLAGSASAAVRSYCILLLIGAAVALLAFFAALILAAVALYTFAAATGKRSSGAERREAKIIFRALFRGRVSLFFSNLLLLVPALFTLYFSILSNRHPGGGFMTLGFDPVLATSLVLAISLASLSFYLAKKERELPFDMFYIEPEEQTDTSGNEMCEEKTAEMPE